VSTATVWLTDEEQRAWRAFLAASQRLFERLERELQKESGLSHADFEVLVRLSEAESRSMRMSELAERALFSRSRLSHAIGRLEGFGWVRREDCATDRRGTFAVLTDAGLAALQAAVPGHVAAVRRFVFSALTPEQVAQLIATSDAIIGALDEQPF
jgi:DNA-binding MarR family transcriptional regulator